MAKESKEKKDPPVKDFRAGGVKASIWENKGKNSEGDPYTYKIVTFERSYKDADGEWQNTGQFRLNDLPKLVVVCWQAYKHLLLKDE